MIVTSYLENSRRHDLGMLFAKMFQPDEAPTRKVDCRCLCLYPRPRKAAMRRNGQESVKHYHRLWGVQVVGMPYSAH